MGLRIPQNQILTNKYTKGGEYLLLNTYKDYQGYYYEFNNKTFAGTEFNINAPEIIKRTSDRVNKLLLNPTTETYGKIAKVVLPLSAPPPPLEDFFEGEPTDDNDFITYYYKKMMGKDILIKEISQSTFNQYQNNPIYQVIAVKTNYGDLGIEIDELNRVEKIMPGFKDWWLFGRPGVTFS